MSNWKLPLILLAALLFLISCRKTKNDNPQLTNSASSELGVINFKVSGSDEAQLHITKGLLLLHSFEYADARTEFLQAQELDSTCAMAYWGEAMTFNHSLWQNQDKDMAVAALEKLAPDAQARDVLVRTELEKELFQGAEILFGKGNKYERDIAYKDFMKNLVNKYPDHHEVSAFYAISLLGASRNGRDEELYAKCARIAQGIMDENANHPGALHYLIHSYDDPLHAHLAEKAADSYAKVAPDATHALHMPSHIYMALGKWNDVVTCNIASWNASVKRMQRKELGGDAKSYHAFSWLHYALLQRGETGLARGLLTQMMEYTAEIPSKGARGYLLAMKGGHMVGTNTWDDEFANTEVDTEDLNITKRAGNNFLEGMTAYHKKDVNKLTEIIEGMRKEREKAQYLVGEKGFAMCKTGGFESRLPDQLDINIAHVMELQLRAYESSMNGTNALALEWFEKAIQMDETLSYSFGPPAILKPAHEAYAEWLLENGQQEKALAIFDKALERQPRRLLSLSGRKRAAELLKKKAIIAKTNTELETSLAEKERAAIL